MSDTLEHTAYLQQAERRVREYAARITELEELLAEAVSGGHDGVAAAASALLSSLKETHAHAIEHLEQERGKGGAN